VTYYVAIDIRTRGVDLMVVLGVLLASLLVFRGLGVLGIDAFSTWQVSGAWALAVMFLFTASAHFTKTKGDLIAMGQKAFPSPRFLVSFTGVLEVLGAVGLLIPVTRSIAGLGLVLLLVAMFPANVNAARKGIPLRGKLATPLWLRGPMQLLFVGMTLWVAWL
jgi:uncharacterized membrane protein